MDEDGQRHPQALRNLHRGPRVFGFDLANGDGGAAHPAGQFFLSQIQFTAALPHLVAIRDIQHKRNQRFYRFLSLSILAKTTHVKFSGDLRNIGSSGFIVTQAAFQGMSASLAQVLPYYTHSTT